MRKIITFGNNSVKDMSWLSWVRTQGRIIMTYHTIAPFRHRKVQDNFRKGFFLRYSQFEEFSWKIENYILHLDNVLVCSIIFYNVQCFGCDWSTAIITHVKVPIKYFLACLNLPLQILNLNRNLPAIVNGPSFQCNLDSRYTYLAIIFHF